MKDIAFIVCGTLVFAFILWLMLTLTAGGITNSPELIEEDNEMVYNITDEEREILARLVYLEAGVCGPECQRAILSVVFNMLEAGYWGDSIKEVVFYPNAFSPAYLIKDCTPNQAAYDAVDYILAHGSQLPKEVRYFRAEYDFDWEGYVNYTIIDNVYFGYFTNGNH